MKFFNFNVPPVFFVFRFKKKTGSLADSKNKLYNVCQRRWVDNIRMDLQEVGCGYMDWIGLAQDRDRWRTLVSAVMNIRVP